MSPRLTLSAWAPAFGTDLRSLVPDVRRAGFGGIQLDAGSAMLDLTALSSSGRREVRHLLSSHDLQLTSIRLDAGAKGLGPTADTDRVLDRIDAILNAATELACPVVCVDLGRLPPAQRVSKPKPKVTENMLGLLVLPGISLDLPAEPMPEGPVPTKVDPALITHWQQAMGQLGEIADRYGAMLALSGGLSSLASLSSLLKHVDCPWFGVDLDTAAILRDEWTLDEVFDELGVQVRHVRARDAVQGDDRRTKPATLGRGDVPWRDVLTRLDESGYQGALTIEPSELPDPRNSAIAGLKQLQAIMTS